MQKILNLGLLVFCLGLLVGCGAIQNSQNQRVQDRMVANLMNCVDNAKKYGPIVGANGRYSRCVLIAYNEASQFSNSDPTKAASLKYINNTYELIVNAERGRIKNEQDFIIAGNRIYDQYLYDFQTAQANSAAANAAASMRQQQMFMNAYKLLTPNGTGGMNCYPIQGGPTFGPTAGGMICQ